MSNDMSGTVASGMDALGFVVFADFMDALPFVVKAAHFAEVRDWLKTRMVSPDFDTAFDTWVNSMALDRRPGRNYFHPTPHTVVAYFLWHFRHDAYQWHVLDTRTQARAPGDLFHIIVRPEEQCSSRDLLLYDTNL